MPPSLRSSSLAAPTYLTDRRRPRRQQDSPHNSRRKFQTIAARKCLSLAAPTCLADRRRLRRQQGSPHNSRRNFQHIAARKCRSLAAPRMSLLRPKYFWGRGRERGFNLSDQSRRPHLQQSFSSSSSSSFSSSVPPR